MLLSKAASTHALSLAFGYMAGLQYFQVYSALCVYTYPCLRNQASTQKRQTSHCKASCFSARIRACNACSRQSLPSTPSMAASTERQTSPQAQRLIQTAC